MRFSIASVPDSDLGVYQFVGLLRQAANAEKILPIVRLTAAAIVKGSDPRDGEAQALKIREWVRSHVSFLRDPYGAELLQTPEYLLTQLSNNHTVTGDCDDVATLAACLALSIGLRARFWMVGFAGPSAPFGHIWAEVQSPTGGPWWELDTTRPLQGFNFSMITRAKSFTV